MEYALIVAIFVPIVLMGCAISVAFEIHESRVEFAAANSEWRRESFRRVDALMWKADTGLEIASAMRFDFGNMITKLRVQVKQSSDESTKAATTQAKLATTAVTNAIDKTSEAIQAVSTSDVVSPKIEADKPITVNVPPPIVVAPPIPPEVPKVEIAATPAKRRRWFRAIWRWGR